MPRVSLRRAAAQRLGALGGRARTLALTPEERRAAALLAARTRWASGRYTVVLDGRVVSRCASLAGARRALTRHPAGATIVDEGAA